MVNILLQFGELFEGKIFGFTIRAKEATCNKIFIFSLDAFMMTPLGYSYIRVINCVEKHT